MKNMIRFDLGDLGFEVFELFSDYSRSVSMIFSSFSVQFQPMATQVDTASWQNVW